MVTKQITLQVNAAAARNLGGHRVADAESTRARDVVRRLLPSPRAARRRRRDQRDLFGLCTNLRDPTTTDGQVVVALDAINPGTIARRRADHGAATGRRQQHGNLEQRINALRSGATGIDLAGLDLNIDGKAVHRRRRFSRSLDTLTGGAASADDFGRWGLFVNGRINFGDKDQTENQAGFDFDTIGVTYRRRLPVPGQLRRRRRARLQQDQDGLRRFGRAISTSTPGTARCSVRISAPTSSTSMRHSTTATTATIRCVASSTPMSAAPSIEPPTSDSDGMETSRPRDRLRLQSRCVDVRPARRQRLLRRRCR